MSEQEQAQAVAALIPILRQHPGRLGVFYGLANDLTPLGLAAAAVNFERRGKDWCVCAEATEQVYWRDPVTGSHGWACAKCKGITQVG